MATVPDPRKPKTLEQTRLKEYMAANLTAGTYEHYYEVGSQTKICGMLAADMPRQDLIAALGAMDKYHEHTATARDKWKHLAAHRLFMYSHAATDGKCSCEFPKVKTPYVDECMLCMKLLEQDGR